MKKWTRVFSDLLFAESAFTKSVMVSLGNSASQQWNFLFDKHGNDGIKANGQYYWDMLYCLKIVSCYQTQCSKYFIFRKQHNCIMHATQSNCKLLQQKVSISSLLGYCPNNPMQNPIDYKITKVILQHEHR